MEAHREQRTLKGIATRFSVRISARELGNPEDIREDIAGIPALAEGSQSVTFQNPLEAIPMSKGQLKSALARQSKQSIREQETQEYLESLRVLAHLEVVGKFSRVEVN